PGPTRQPLSSSTQTSAAVAVTRRLKQAGGPRGPTVPAWGSSARAARAAAGPSSGPAGRRRNSAPRPAGGRTLAEVAGRRPRSAWTWTPIPMRSILALPESPAPVLDQRQAQLIVLGHRPLRRPEAHHGVAGRLDAPQRALDRPVGITHVV